MRAQLSVLSLVLLLVLCVPAGLAGQSTLVEAKTAAGVEVATIRTDSMRLAVPLHLLVGGLLFPDGTLQTTAAGGTTSVTSADIVDGTIVNADISLTAAIADTKLGTITSAGKVANSATTATSSNTAGAIVARDAVGGFSAGYVAVADSFRVGGEGSFVAAGTYNGTTTVPPPASGPGTRMMWYPEKAAFRAGYVDGTQWDANNVGSLSVAMGYNAVASGSISTALGYQTVASGYYSTALGGSTTANGTGATALGLGTTATSYATALGYYATASASYSTAMGANTTASGSASMAAGSATTASGVYSAALGNYATAQALASVVIGHYNVVQGSKTTWVATDPLFVAGNGSYATPSNALTLYKNGNLTIAGTLTQSSDARLKEDIEPLGSTLEKVMQLTPIRYRFRPGAGRPEGGQIGLTAQQIQPLFPELVKQDGDGYLSLSYANLSAVLVKAVQEQQAEIEPLRAQVEELKARNRALEAELKTRTREMQSELATLRASQSEILRRLRELEAGGAR